MEERVTNCPVNYNKRPSKQIYHLSKVLKLNSEKHLKNQL